MTTVVCSTPGWGRAGIILNRLLVWLCASRFDIFVVAQADSCNQFAALNHRPKLM